MFLNFSPVTTFTPLFLALFTRLTTLSNCRLFMRGPCGMINPWVLFFFIWIESQKVKGLNGSDNTFFWNSELPKTRGTNGSEKLVLFSFDIPLVSWGTYKIRETRSLDLMTQRPKTWSKPWSKQRQPSGIVERLAGNFLPAAQPQVYKPSFFLHQQIWTCLNLSTSQPHPIMAVLRTKGLWIYYDLKNLSVAGSIRSKPCFKRVVNW